MRKLIAFSLVVALVFFVFAPLPVFAGSPNWGEVLGAVVLGGVAIEVGKAAFGIPPYGPQRYPVDVSQPVYAPQMIYASQLVCVGGPLDVEYGWRTHPSGNGVEYVPTGRTFCRGQIRVSPSWW